MNGNMRERWTEDDVAALPLGEHDYFDRKSGALLTDPDFRRDLAKALSAFANSGGGHLVIGVENDGTFDGVSKVHKGRTPTREWLEQIIPDMLSHPLEEFRVHEVEPADPSSIPAGQVLIIVDVGDSALAPHQAAESRIYYYREGGHSKPAPHFYLETLRNRLVNPQIVPELAYVRFVRAYRQQEGVVVRVRLHFQIKNTGNIAAYKWALPVEFIDYAADRLADYRFDAGELPKDGTVSLGGIRIDTTILPGLYMTEEIDIGVFLRPSAFDEQSIADDLSQLLRGLIVRYRAVSETSRGEIVSTELSTVLGARELAAQTFATLSR